jgi:3-deoxy-D-manno-octulosonate 8-phosphate phosphatase (KDO 8-P phosphatase)
VAALDSLRERLGLAPREVAVMGDDLPDLPAMARAGMALAPANAVTEIKRMAHWIARRRGGDGAVREAVEMLLKARRSWPPR